MKKFLLLFLIPFIQTSGIAQNINLSGSINKYSKVTSISYCGNRITVDTPGLFQVGMQVLIIQMQGVTIDQSNSASYGNITNYNSAGNYEIQTIDSILGDTIKFRYEIERAYDPSHSVQLIPQPIYQTATINSVLRCKQWDGATGGVLVLKADTLIMNDSIDITGMGFRGFYVNDSSQLCISGGNFTDYIGSPDDSIHGGIKGEGVVQYPYKYCRGKNANGGGGGDNENTGGGGGSNFSKGGAGGGIVYRTAFCQGNGPGDGGIALIYNDTANKIYMGGGGGCGHGNNSEGTAGTNGGGICLITAKVVIGNNQSILANGIDQNNVAGSDGAGGAGAGGTVLLDVNQYIGNISIRTAGGTGGSLNNDYLTRSCMGPGGGGSGGVLWVKQATVPANVSFTAPGGANGFNQGTGSTFCPYGVTNGALPGNAGGTVTGLITPIALRPYIRLYGSASHDTVLCNDQQITLTASGISSDTVYYVWSTGQQTSSVSFLATQSGPYNVTVSDQNGCSLVKIINLKVYNVSPNFTPNTFLCSPQNLTLSAQNPGTTAVTYEWSNGSGSPSITFFADSSTSYAVTVYSDSLPTCIAIDTIHIYVGNLNITFSPPGITALCPGTPVVLTVNDSLAGSLSYYWSTGEVTASITVSPTTNTSYEVTVTAGTNCSTIHRFVINMDYLGTIASPDTTICRGGTASVSVSVPNVNNVAYHWSNGDTTQHISVTPSANQTYTVTVSSLAGCTGSAMVHVNVDSIYIHAIPVADTICPGGVANLSATANGIRLGIVYHWSSGQMTQSINVNPQQGQTYTVTATDSLGCIASDQVSVVTDNNASHLNPQITAIPDSAAAPGDSVQLTVTGVGLSLFQWTPGEYLSDSMIESPIATPLKATSYCVDVTDSSHCTAEICKEIIVGIPPARIAIPDAFTPNNDGKNDVYHIQAIDGTIIASVRIYDRWGQLLFDDNNDQGWDGMYKGVAQMTGSYSCYITYYQKIYPDRLFYKIGSFSLLR